MNQGEPMATLVPDTETSVRAFQQREWFEGGWTN